MKTHQGLIVILVLSLFIFLTSIWPSSDQLEYEMEESNISSVQLKWEARLQGENVGSRLILDDTTNSIYIMTYSALTALKLETGEIVWMNEDSGGTLWQDRTLQLQDNIMLATGNETPLLRAFASKTGDLLWERDYSYNEDNSRNLAIFSVLSDPLRVYIATIRQDRGTDIEAVELSTGQPLWTISADQVFHQQGVTSFLLTQNRLYVEAGDLYGVDKATGHILEEYPALFRNARNGIIEEFVAYYADGAIQAVSLSPDTAEPTWRTKWRNRPARYPRGVSHLFPIESAEHNVVYARATCNSPIRWCESVLKLDKENGDILWSVDTKGSPVSIAVEEDDLYALTTSANLAHIDAETGDLLGTLQFSPKRTETVGRQVLAYSKGWLIVANGNNQIFGFQKIK